MSEEAIIEEFGLSEEVNNNEETNQEAEAEPAPEATEFSLEDWENSHEEKAKSQGWTDLNTFVASGKDPSDWRPASVFVERGEWLRERKQLRQQVKESGQQFQKRLENVNHIHEQQQAIMIRELEGKRDDAIDRGDSEEARRHMADIKEVEAAAPVVDTASPAMDKAEGLDTMIKGGDSWIYETTPKAAYAQQQLRGYWAQGIDNEDILSKVKEDVSREFQDVNHNRNAPATTTTTTAAPARQASSRPLAMADLTRSEEKLWNGGHGLWTNQKQFLQAVQDARKS
jgi:hypothetical protein